MADNRSFLHLWFIFFTKNAQTNQLREPKAIRTTGGSGWDSAGVAGRVGGVYRGVADRGGAVAGQDTDFIAPPKLQLRFVT